MGESLENLASELGVWALGDSLEAGELGVEERALGLCGIALLLFLSSPPVSSPGSLPRTIFTHATPPKPGFQWLEQPSTAAHSHSPHSLLVACQLIIPHGSTLGSFPKEAIPSLLDRALFQPFAWGF